MMRNIRLTIAYDGANYLGWQATSSGPSIESTLEAVLWQILQEKVCLQAASRTDAGVHAQGQVVNFILQKDHPSLNQLRMSLIHLLPKDIAILEIAQVEDSFHPTLDCVSKEYHYSVCYGAIQLPQRRFYSWHYTYHLDINLMKEAISHLIGYRDFSAFCNTRPLVHYDHYMRHVHSIEIEDLEGRHLRFKIVGNNFLYKMVRNLVGTLVYVGCKKIAVNRIPEILASKRREHAGITAPAHGLSLFKVYYPRKTPVIGLI